MKIHKNPTSIIAPRWSHLIEKSEFPKFQAFCGQPVIAQIRVYANIILLGINIIFDFIPEYFLWVGLDVAICLFTIAIICLIKPNWKTLIYIGLFHVGLHFVIFFPPAPGIFWDTFLLGVVPSCLTISFIITVIKSGEIFGLSDRFFDQVAVYETSPVKYYGLTFIYKSIRRCFKDKISKITVYDYFIFVVATYVAFAYSVVVCFFEIPFAMGFLVASSAVTGQQSQLLFLLEALVVSTAYLSQNKVFVAKLDPYLGVGFFRNIGFGSFAEVWINLKPALVFTLILSFLSKVGLMKACEDFIKKSVITKTVPDALLDDTNKVLSVNENPDPREILALSPMNDKAFWAKFGDHFLKYANTYYTITQTGGLIGAGGLVVGGAYQTNVVQDHLQLINENAACKKSLNETKRLQAKIQAEIAELERVRAFNQRLVYPYLTNIGPPLPNPSAVVVQGYLDNLNPPTEVKETPPTFTKWLRTITKS